MSGLRVTFYSYKGGVGRTLALLNVGALLAANGRRVVAVDLDLEAPGFGLSSLTRRSGEAPPLGVSDLLHDRLAGGTSEFLQYAYTVLPDRCGDNFRIIPAGTKLGWLASLVPSLYRDTTKDTAELFLLLIDEIEAALRPNFILVDSRTGRADIAGVALLQLAQAIVAVTGLNEQNVAGMEGVLTQLRTHPARRAGVLTLLAASPVPDKNSLPGPPLGDDTLLMAGGGSRPAGDGSVYDSLLKRAPETGRELLQNRIDELQRILLAPILQEFATETQQHFPNVSQPDLFHLLPYDPLVPLTDELQVTRDSELSRAYARLADSIARARTGDAGMPELWRRRAGPLLP